MAISDLAVDVERRIMSSEQRSSAAHDKSVIRDQIWRYLEEQNIARFPRPVYRRIPNFEGAEEAARRLAAMDEFEGAKVVKVNPDSPQRQVRFEILMRGKTLLMPTPRLRSGFILLNPTLPEDRLKLASTIRGAFVLGKQVPLSRIPKIDLLVVGSVAVARDGGRIGKGEGYSEMEYAILQELGLVGDATPIITTVHDSQIVASVPLEEHDISVDYVVTPTRVMKTTPSKPRPTGVIWSRLTSDVIERIPVLKELRQKGLS